MAYLARLDLDSLTEVPLYHCSYSLHRSVDHTGKPSSGVYGGTVQFELESTDDTSLLEWICMPTKRKNGKITFYKDKDEAAMKAIEFEDAYITEYAESMDAIGNNPMTQRVTLSAKKIKMGGAELENEWPKG